MIALLLCLFSLCPLSLFSLLTGSNADIVFSLADSADGTFSVDERSGLLRLEQPLDRELRSVYTLRARATDMGSPRRLSSLCDVSVSVLDINDDPPVFERREYAATLAEDVTAGTQVLRVHATSREREGASEITYGIVSGNERGVFRVEPSTGMKQKKSFLKGERFEQNYSKGPVLASHHIFLFFFFFLAK